MKSADPVELLKAVLDALNAFEVAAYRSAMPKPRATDDEVAARHDELRAAQKAALKFLSDVSVTSSGPTK